MLSKEQIEQIVQMTLAQLNKNCPAEKQAGQGQCEETGPDGS